jgi:hypothetical protein
MDSKECGCRSDQLRGLARISLRANSVYSFDDDLKRVRERCLSGYSGRSIARYRSGRSPDWLKNPAAPAVGKKGWR